MHAFQMPYLGGLSQPTPYIQAAFGATSATAGVPSGLQLRPDLQVIDTADSAEWVQRHHSGDGGISRDEHHRSTMRRETTKGARSPQERIEHHHTHPFRVPVTPFQSFDNGLGAAPAPEHDHYAYQPPYRSNISAKQMIGPGQERFVVHDLSPAPTVSPPITRVQSLEGDHIDTETLRTALDPSRAAAADLIPGTVADAWDASSLDHTQPQGKQAPDLGPAAPSIPGADFSDAGAASLSDPRTPSHAHVNLVKVRRSHSAPKGRDFTHDMCSALSVVCTGPGSDGWGGWPCFRGALSRRCRQQIP